MRAITVLECEKWCAERGVVVGKNSQMGFVHGSDHVYEVSLPTLALKIVALSILLSGRLDGGSHPRTLLWLVEYGMWSEAFEAVGCRLWKRLLHGGNLQAGAVDELPSGYVFEDGEVDDERAFLIALMGFQWDGALIPEHGRYAVFMSHDGYIKLFGRDLETAAVLSAAATSWNAA